MFLKDYKAFIYLLIKPGLIVYIAKELIQFSEFTTFKCGG